MPVPNTVTETKWKNTGSGPALAYQLRSGFASAVSVNLSNALVSAAYNAATGETLSFDSTDDINTYSSATASTASATERRLRLRKSRFLSTSTKLTMKFLIPATSGTSGTGSLAIAAQKTTASKIVAVLYALSNSTNGLKSNPAFASFMTALATELNTTTDALSLTVDSSSITLTVSEERTLTTYESYYAYYNSFSTAAKIGVGVGVGLGLPLLVLAARYAFVKRLWDRKSQLKNATVSPEGEPPPLPISVSPDDEQPAPVALPHSHTPDDEPQRSPCVIVCAPETQPESLAAFEGGDSSSLDGAPAPVNRSDVVEIADCESGPIAANDDVPATHAEVSLSSTESEPAGSITASHPEVELSLPNLEPAPGATLEPVLEEPASEASLSSSALSVEDIPGFAESTAAPVAIELDENQVPPAPLYVVAAPPAAEDAPPAAVDVPPAAMALPAVSAPPATILTEEGPANTVPLLDHPLFSIFSATEPAFARGADSPQGQAAISTLIQLIDDFETEEEAVPVPPPPTMPAPPRGQGRVLRRGLVLNPNPSAPELQLSGVTMSPAKKSLENAMLAYSSSPRPHFPQKLSRQARSPSSGRTAARKVAKTSDPPRRSASPRSPGGAASKIAKTSTSPRSASPRSLDMATEINTFFAAAAPPKRLKRGGARVAPM